jgi:hypothetical protein
MRPSDVAEVSPKHPGVVLRSLAEQWRDVEALPRAQAAHVDAAFALRATQAPARYLCRQRLARSTAAVAAPQHSAPGGSIQARDDSLAAALVELLNEAIESYCHPILNASIGNFAS